MSVSWALLPLLTDHILSCRRFLSLPTRSNGGRLTQGNAAQCHNHASMLTGSHLTRKCLLLFSLGLKEGILRDVFIQKAVVAWDNASSFMRRERRRLQARHVWEKIESNWPMIEERVWTKQATGLPYQVLYRRLFLHEYTEESRWLENSYKGPHVHWIRQQWERSCAWFAGQAAAQSPSQWVSTLEDCSVMAMA